MRQKPFIRCFLLGFLWIGYLSGLQALTGAEVYESQYKDPARYPLGCKNVGYQYQLNVLTLRPKIDTEEITDGQTMYFIYNSLSVPINLHQMLGESSTRDTFLNHSILPKQWGVLAMNQRELNFICSVNSTPMKYGYGAVVNCGESLKICEYARVKFGLNNKGNYWIVNSTTRGSAVGGVVRYGIIPR